MIGTVSVLIGALTRALSVVLVGKRLHESNFFSAALVITVIGNIVLWPLTLAFTNLITVDFEGILLFLITGALAPGIIRLFYYKGVETVGVSVNATILATGPMYSSVLAVFLLGETLLPENWIGITCIVIGVALIANTNISNQRSKQIRKKGLVFPFLSAIIGALSSILSKYGLNSYNEPLFGMALGYASTLLLYLALKSSSRTEFNPLFSGKDFRLFWKSGVFLSFGWFLSLYALSHEDVAIVTPLNQIETLFVILFAYFYLKKKEFISSKLLISSILIVLGAILVSYK